MNLKIVEAVYTAVTGEPGHLVQSPSIVMARVSLRPSYLDKILYPEGTGEILRVQTLTDDKKGNSTGFGRE